MKEYYRITCENGYCGCNEEFYEEIEFEDNIKEEDKYNIINKYAEEMLFNNYSFAEPDGRFIDGKSFDDEITEEEYEEYQEGLSFYWEEISKEEYEENI